MMSTMETEKLLAVGLTKSQAEAYALLIENGEITPPAAAKELALTRTNAYKLFEKLTELGLAKKSPTSKSAYQLGNPMALTAFAANMRAEATAREEAISAVMKGLLTKYYEYTEQPSIAVVSGKLDVANAFRNQINLDQDVYFIRTPADIPLMSFDTMHEIRTSPSRRGRQRYGILPDDIKGPVNYKGHERSNLEFTWVKHEDYDAPVEWSVTSSSLMIILYGVEPHAITINNPIIAGAFMQLWHLLDGCLRAMPYYKTLPRNEA
jgi:sugar-specific transcriptional regulator TrmB